VIRPFAGASASCAGPVCGAPEPLDRAARDQWRMPPLETLTRPVMATGRKIGMGALRGYLFVALVLVVIKLVEVALAR